MPAHYLPTEEKIFKADRPYHHEVILSNYLTTFDNRNLTKKYKQNQEKLLREVFKNIEIGDPDYPTIQRPIDTIDLCNPSLAGSIIDAINQLFESRKNYKVNILKAVRRYALFVKDTHTINVKGQKPLHLPTLYGPMESPVGMYDIPRDSSENRVNHRYLTEKEYKQWLKFTHGQIKADIPLRKQKRAYSFHVMCVIAGETGLRLQEILGIQPADIHWDDKKLLVTHGKGSKGSGHRKRLVTLSPLSIATISEFINFGKFQPNHYIFQDKNGSKLSINTAHGWMRQAKKKILNSGIRIYLPVGFGWHAFRRTFTKKAIKQGMSIEALKRNNGWSYNNTIGHYYGDEKPIAPEGKRYGN